MDFDLCINNAISKTDKLEHGTIFILKDLFVGTDWEELSRGVRQNLGRQFKSKVIANSIKGVVLVTDSQKGKATTYKKI